MKVLGFYIFIYTAFLLTSLSVFYPVVDSFAGNIGTSFSGQIKLSVTAAQYKDRSIQSEFKDGRWLGENFNLRIKTRTFFNDNLSFDCHYLLNVSKSDSIKASAFFAEKYKAIVMPGVISRIFQNEYKSDNTKLFDLSSSITQGNGYLLDHRFDRLNLSFENDLGKIVLGRQAVTWGNGLVFNPMDIFNPFSPYDTDRSYKNGSDMAYFEVFLKDDKSLQLIYVPGRDPQTHDIRFSKSSLGMKYHCVFNTMELDFMIAEHYNDTLAGMGCVVTPGNMIVRSDIIYTFTKSSSTENFLSLIINTDYSWVWFARNFYGLIEYCYSGIGRDDYSKAYTDPEFFPRIERGDLFGLGRHYLSSSLKIGLTPLVDFNFTAIVNLDDPSYIFQPGITWSIMENFEITIGANLKSGSEGDEYGQILLPFSNRRMDSGSNIFLMVTFFF